MIDNQQLGLTTKETTQQIIKFPDESDEKGNPNVLRINSKHTPSLHRTPILLKLLKQGKVKLIRCS